MSADLPREPISQEPVDSEDEDLSDSELAELPRDSSAFKRRFYVHPVSGAPYLRVSAAKKPFYPFRSKAETREEIAQQRARRKEAASLGTDMHARIAQALTQGVIAEDDGLVIQPRFNEL